MGQRAVADPLLRAFGHHVRDLRKARGLSQEQLADRAGLHTTYVSSLERGLRNVGLLNIAAVAHALDLTVGQLLQGMAMDG